ncbi:MAG: uroporphyrinogen-III C-methyltransferase [Thermodesulfobacteriota bacterium]|nr:uroporphyrinogen-III C-methyltransferase [Thermodesulfobacteriota bacterium]
MKKPGKVYIIGAGPGDPDLITIKGVECLRRADVVVHDYLVGKEILRHAGKYARFIYVGKIGGHQNISQENLNRILVEEALKGNTVVRLKGGDPFMFGRGGEEAEFLQKAGVSFEVVPGITSAISVPAYAGIPLTHRKFTSTLAFVTGHEDPERVESRIDWKKISTIETIVFLMGVRNLSRIASNLMENGRSPDTPVALIRWGTTPDQETLTGKLGDIATLVEERKFSPPAVFVVGDVVGLRERLGWFEKKTLFGKGIVITRPEEQSEEFAALLRDEGARVISFPTIRIVPPEDYSDLDRAIENIEKYHWIVFTSANGVRFFFERFCKLRNDIRDLKGIKICTIGPATRDRVEGYNIRVDMVPEEYISDGVVEAFRGMDVAGANVLLPRAEIAGNIIPGGLSELGANVDVATAYKTVNSGEAGETIKELMDSGKIDVITFTSPSTVTNFMDIIGNETTIPNHIKIACIGPVTENACRKAGLGVDIMQGPYSIPGLVEAIKTGVCQ